jgi:hypothetical protein
LEFFFDREEAAAQEFAGAAEEETVARIGLV